MRLHSLTRRFGDLLNDRRGSIGLITGLLLVPLVGSVGFGIDYTRAVTYRMKLDAAASAAALAAIEAVRIHLVNNPDVDATTLSNVGKARALTVFTARAPMPNASFLADKIVVERVGDTVSTTIEYSGSVRTTVANIFSLSKIGVSGVTRSSGPLAPADDGNPEDPDVLLRENFTKNLGQFERGPGGGAWGMRQDYNNWKTPAGRIEIGDINRAYKFDRPPSGSTNAAELDANSNVSLSRKLYLPSGKYELRYWTRDRIPQTDYDPAWVCGTKTEDVSWARDPHPNAKWGYQTNRVATYLDLAPNDTPPVYLTADTNNLIDVCVLTGQRWVERKVVVTVTSPGFYWLTFQAEGKSDAYGGLITDIMFCRKECKQPVHDNFPWAANTLLFFDSFETPTGDGLWTERTLDNSGTNHGWPRLPTGWTTWPINQVDFQPGARKTGVVGIELDASWIPGTINNSNRAVSRRFILPPGYYRVRYWFDNAMPISQMATLCGTKDTATQIVQANLLDPRLPGDSRLLRVYMDPHESFSSPFSEPILRTLAKWQNPDGSAPTLPRLPRTVIDACVITGQMVERVTNIRISKNGFYWLTFQAQGHEDQHGPSIDDVEFIALSGLSGQAPANAVNIPAPGLPAGTTIRLNGIEVLSN